MNKRTFRSMLRPVSLSAVALSMACVAMQFDKVAAVLCGISFIPLFIEIGYQIAGGE